MKIGITFPAGLEQYAEKMQKELSAKGHIVRIVSFTVPPTSKELSKFVDGIEIYVAAGLEKITAEVINLAPNLRAILRFGAGYDNVDLSAARKRDIWVTNVPGENADSVAELALALMLTLARNIPTCHNLVHEGGWRIISGQELRGKTLGIIGLGAIGKSLVEKVQGLQMSIVGYDVKWDQEFSDKFGVKRLSFDDLLKISDFISLHLPLNKHTKNLISFRELSLMKENAYLINTSRGGVVDEEALVQVLKERRIAGAALDVLSTEPPEKCELRGMDNVILTPHIGGSTHEAISRITEVVMENIARIEQGKEPLHVVD